MTLDPEQTAREWREDWIDCPVMLTTDVHFTSWADECGLTADQQRAVRRESDLLEVGDEPAD